MEIHETMKQSKKTIRELKKAGFARIGETDLFINPSGLVYNRQTDKTSRHKRLKIADNQPTISRAAAVLWTFKNQPPRPKQQIVFKDGDRNNLNPANLKYTSIGVKEVVLNTADLYLAIRKYITVNEKWRFDIRTIETRLYLSVLAEINKFSYVWDSAENTEVVKEYLNGFETIRKISKKHGLTVRDTRNLIYDLLNRMAKGLNSRKNEILPTAKRITEKQRTKQALKDWHEITQSIYKIN